MKTIQLSVSINPLGWSFIQLLDILIELYPEVSFVVLAGSSAPLGFDEVALRVLRSLLTHESLTDTTVPLFHTTRGFDGEVLEHRTHPAYTSQALVRPGLGKTALSRSFERQASPHHALASVPPCVHWGWIGSLLCAPVQPGAARDDTS